MEISNFQKIDSNFKINISFFIWMNWVNSSADVKAIVYDGNQVTNVHLVIINFERKKNENVDL